MTVGNVDKHRVEQTRSLYHVQGRRENIATSAARVLEVPFQNVKTSTPNRTDKDQFFSLMYFCYTFVKCVHPGEVDVKFQKNAEYYIYLFGSECLDFIGSVTVAKFTADRAMLEKFNLVYGNMLSLFGIFVEFQSQIKNLLTEIQSKFEIKLVALTDAALLSASEWEEWTRHIEKVSRQLIIVRSIAITVPAFAPRITSLIVDLLDSYLRRGNDEDAKEFIARLGHSLENSSSNGVGQRVVEEFSVFHGHKTLIHNQQFDRVPIGTIVFGMRILPTGGTKDVPLNPVHKVMLVKLHQRFNLHYWAVVDKGLPLTTREGYISSIPKTVKDLAVQVMTTRDNKVILDSMLPMVVYCFAYWTLHDLTGYDTTPTAKQYRGQVIVVLRLLGLDAMDDLTIPRRKRRALGWFFGLFQPTETSKIELRSHLAQIRTGEGEL
eukprot:gene44030-54716_t